MLEFSSRDSVSGRSFSHRNDDDDDFDDDDLIVLWCLKWNQGCFDVALYKRGTLATLQFTVSSSHSLKLQYLSRLRSALKRQSHPVDTVAHWFVVGGKSLRRFMHKSPTGTGRSNGTLQFTVRVCNSTRFQKLDGEEQNAAMFSHWLVSRSSLINLLFCTRRNFLFTRNFFR